MKYLDEFRDPELARTLLDQIAATVTRHWVMMEVCGGQTHSIIRNGIDKLLPPEVELVHGPGCPVCVTPLDTIDKALAIAAQPGVIFCSFGDMLRVPGSDRDLFRVKSEYTTRTTRSGSPSRTPTARWSSSASASRRPHRPTRWLST